MSAVRHRDPGERWQVTQPVLSLGNSMPVRTVNDDPDPTFSPRPVGFTAPLQLIERDPEVWEGDQA